MDKSVVPPLGRSWTVNFGSVTYGRVREAVLARPLKGVRFDASGYARQAVLEKLERDGF